MCEDMNICVMQSSIKSFIMCIIKIVKFFNVYMDITWIGLGDFINLRTTRIPLGHGQIQGGPFECLSVGD